ncbi:MAG: hypothetical protein AAF242_01965 [Bacteroidota bacterium]
MINTILYIGFFAVFFAIWNYIRTSTLTNASWKILGLSYSTTETEQSLDGTRLDIVFFYMDRTYMERTYKFYSTKQGLLIRPSSDFLNKEYVLIPWDKIQQGELKQNRSIGTTRVLHFIDAENAELEIQQSDYTQYIRPRMRMSNN